MAEERCKENTFHPRINQVSELMHQKKMLLLEQVNKAAAAIVKSNNDATEILSSGLQLERETKENLFEYYLPKSKLIG